MSFAFQVAVIGLALFFGAMSMLGFFVLVKVFITAMRMRAQLAAIAAAAEKNK